MKLRYQTPAQWTQTVLDDFSSFLLDHAACERKASATAMSLVAHYPDRKELVANMIELAQEELEHFAQVYQHIEARELILTNDSKDPYVTALRQLNRNGTEEYFLDRLLIAGMVEARGCERFAMIAEALPKGELKDFYWQITRSEARHSGLFFRLTKCYFVDELIDARLDELLDAEAKIVKNLPLRAALH